MPEQEVMVAAAQRSADRFTGIKLVSESEALQFGRDGSSRFRLRVPIHWKSPLFMNPYAEEAEERVMEWFEGLGCEPPEMQRAYKFNAAGYVGIPFPGLSPEMTVRIGKYLSLWLLWDDVHIESLENRWRIKAVQVVENHRPKDMTRFDQGWWELLREFAVRRSSRWMQALCEAMITWNNAAVQEAISIQAWYERGNVPRFADQIEVRIATIGMYATVYLLEDEYDFEFPHAFHEHPVVKQLKKTANLIVGLGNDIFSFGKDMSEGQLNLVSTFMLEGSVSGDEALEQVIRMHDRALEMYDRLAESVGSWGEEADRFIARWLQDVRYASLGFSLWEAQAPRYTAHKIVVGGRVIEPSFAYY